MSRASWPQERIDRMMALWGRGYSASDIGAAIDMSRSAVLGKLYRMRLEAEGKRKSYNAQRWIKAKQSGYASSTGGS